MPRFQRSEQQQQQPPYQQQQQRHRRASDQYDMAYFESQTSAEEDFRGNCHLIAQPKCCHIIASIEFCPVLREVWLEQGEDNQQQYHIFTAISL